MRCARNLVDACLRDDENALFALTRQIFGMCDVHGVANPKALFDEYRDLVNKLTVIKSKDDVVGMMDALVWAPSQRNLAALLDVNPREWSSILTTSATPEQRKIKSVFM